MDNLTLEHIAPYLPYGLKVSHITYPECDRHRTIIVDVESLHKECVTFSDGMDYYFEDPQDNECLIKPILRPLSDLTKEIEHKGEKFIPYYWFGRKGIKINSIKDERWHIVQKLLSWHFDVFGLIDKGLAIDINTLK